MNPDQEKLVVRLRDLVLATDRDDIGPLVASAAMGDGPAIEIIRDVHREAGDWPVVRKMLVDMCGDVLDAEHGDCKDVSCDVFAARENGDEIYALDRLVHSTDAPLASTLHRLIEPTGDEIERERANLAATEHWTCEECNAVNWTSDYAAPCASCRNDPAEEGRTHMAEAEHAMGDVNAPEYDGGWVWPDGSAAYVETADEDCKRRRWYVYRFDVPDELEASDLAGAAKSCGCTVDELRAPFLEALAPTRAEALALGMTEEQANEQAERRMATLRARVGSVEAVAGWASRAELMGEPHLVSTRRRIETTFPT